MSSVRILPTSGVGLLLAHRLVGDCSGNLNVCPRWGASSDPSATA